MIDIKKYKDYIAIFRKDSNKLCGLLKKCDNDRLYLLLCKDYSLIFGDLLTEEDFKYAWVRDIAKFYKDNIEEIK